MSNMSYCRFQNTSMDLRDCVNEMDEAYTLRDMDLSREELESMKWMRELCERFLANSERLQNADDSYEDRESQEYK